jgi:hypothetical protein
MSTERAADMQSRQQLSAGPVQPTLEHAMVSARARIPTPDSLRGAVNDVRIRRAAQPRARQAGVSMPALLAAARLRDATRGSCHAPETTVAGDAPAQRPARLLPPIAQSQQDWPRVRSWSKRAANAGPSWPHHPA